MGNPLTIEVVKTEKLGSGEIWYGFNIYDKHDEAFRYEEQSEEAFRAAYPSTSNILTKVMQMDEFGDMNFEKAEIIFDAPSWMNHGHDALDIFYSTDQPETCRKCGARTEFEDLLSGRQRHECPKCKYVYLVEEEEDTETESNDSAGLSEEQFELISDQLSNNDTSSDDELFAFLAEHGIPAEHCTKAISLRDKFLTNPSAKLKYSEFRSNRHEQR